MKKVFGVVGVCVLLGIAAWMAIPAQAQSGNQVYVGQAFDFVQPHNGLRTDSFHLVLSGPSVNITADQPVSALVAGKVTFANLSVSLAGNYTIVVTAIGPGGSVASDPFALSVVAVPNPPDKPLGGYIVKH